jgi:hypothetical protein
MLDALLAERKDGLKIFFNEIFQIFLGRSQLLPFLLIGTVQFLR